MQPKVSIIVPVYCVEKYLHACVDSLLAQTLEDIEIILVDDGSPDQSGKIADEYAEKDSRIKVIHQSNAGLGPARNTGMEAATGEYIGFVDSDDWVKPEMYERLYEAAVQTDADIVASGHCDYTGGKAVKVKAHPLKGKTMSNKMDVLRVRKNLYGYGLHDKTVEAFPMSVCISIYRKSMLDENGICFRNILSEDRVFNLSAYQCAQVLTCTDETDYCYRKEGQTSITQTFSRKKLLQYQAFLTTLLEMARTEDFDCVMRAKRMAIDYCRLYVGIVENAAEPFYRKCQYVREFAETEEIAQCWEGYPLEYLPIQQRVFHRMIIHGHYGMALTMNWFRQVLKKGARVFHGSTK